MKTGDSFSKNDIEKTSLNFSELRNKGIEYLQELGGDIWTDYNLHDPGLTILEQLCYGLTDIGYRTAYPLEDLLVKNKDLPIDARANAFFSPSDIFSSHPVTNTDLRKLIIDRFDEVQNVWISRLKNEGFHEEISGLSRIEVLPKLRFIRKLSADQHAREDFINRLKKFLNANRNMGEYFSEVCLLQPRPVEIKCNIHLPEQNDIEQTLSQLFLSLFEYIYVPVRFRTPDEMLSENQTIEEMFAGPRLIKGFLPDEPAKERIRVLDVDILQRLFSKADGVVKCEVKSIVCGDTESQKMTIDPDHFFHLLKDTGQYDSNARFDYLYSQLKVFINEKEINLLHKDVINNLLFEKWSKKYRAYSMGDQKEKTFNEKLEKTYRDPGNYHSLQRHFPLIYNIGPEGLADSEPEEKKAKASQLKAFLMLFEHHLGGHLSQLANLNHFFDIDFSSPNEPAFRNEWINSVPNWATLFPDHQLPASQTESQEAYLKKKNAVYDHMLARFGEELSEVPWKISARLHLLRNEKEYLLAVIRHKSLFLKNVDRLGYNRSKGESIGAPEVPGENEIAGLEEIICLKSGIPLRNKPIVKKLSEQPATLLAPGEHYHNIEQLHHNYRPVRLTELPEFSENENVNLSPSFLGGIEIKLLFRETVNPQNYRISRKTSDDQNKIQVIFRKETRKWVRLYEGKNEADALRFVAQSINYFTELNHHAEGFYLLDHILLLDMLADSQFGFSFKSEYGDNFFGTMADESWSQTESERQNSLQEFFLCAPDADNYRFENKQWLLQNNEGKVIATSAPLPDTENPVVDRQVEKAKNYIRFFSSPEEKNGAERYAEMEKIRLMGSIAGRNFGQRRLVFQRRLSNGQIINEDFFDFQVSFLFPDWPARFQEARFRDFITELIRERIPSHIKNNILWIDRNQMQNFESVYQKWKDAKARQKEQSDKHHLAKLAFDVYTEIQTLKAAK
ncbi:hypothetical protein D1614_00715 [Maribellus luteus]|uniref:Uncharacterized protein n=1 Tax=Maribellus luteus TaxID=2305463 RepID=A0A399T203_9BACT|nr:hypothetical protein [Maribellus luteus]RIJ50490.1 hypothetical protein D1614_00715 [Maribellus luteus]